MIGKLGALFRSPVLKGAIAIGCAGLAVKMLSDVVAELRGQIDELSAVAHDRGFHLARLNMEIARAERAADEQRRAHVPYPAPGDVDPLGRGELVDEPVDEPGGVNLDLRLA